MEYDIGIPEIICTEKYEDSTGRCIKYDAEAAHRPSICKSPKCNHEIKPHIHDTKTNLIKDIKTEGKMVIINLKIHRYKCPDCGYVFPDEFSFYEKRAHITYRLKDEFVRRCLCGETSAYIARDYSVSDKTVTAAFTKYAKEHLDDEVITQTPEVLGIDEAHIDDHYRLVLTDISKRKLIDIKKNNKTPTVTAYLKTLDPQICRVVSMDFAKGYAYCVQKILPDALIVIDHFHVIQEVNRCVDMVRKDLQNLYRSEGYDIRIFKHAKRLFMANLEDLDDKATAALDRWFSQFPDLYAAYMVKETLREIYSSCSSYEEAEPMFDRWLNDIPDHPRFSAMKATFADRKEHVLNYFRCGETNAFTESANNKIKKIEKAGRGYKFENLRLRCLLSINKGIDSPFDQKEAIFIKSDSKSSFEAKRKAFQNAIDDVTRLLDAGMYATAEQKRHVVPFDERFCKTPPLSVLRRITIINEDFTESDQKS